MTTDTPTFTMERRFDAPVELVWRAWTEPDLFARWYGPGAETVILDFDASQGGGWKLEMRMGERVGYQSARFDQVEAPRRLSMLQQVHNADWEVASDPNMPDWPRALRADITLTPDGDGTLLRLDWTPEDAEAREIEFFRQMMDNLGRGWGMGFDELARMLEEMQAA